MATLQDRIFGELNSRGATFPFNEEEPDRLSESLEEDQESSPDAPGQSLDKLNRLVAGDQESLAVVYQDGKRLELAGQLATLVTGGPDVLIAAGELDTGNDEQDLVHARYRAIGWLLRTTGVEFAVSAEEAEAELQSRDVTLQEAAAQGDEVAALIGGPLVPEAQASYLQACTRRLVIDTIFDFAQTE